MFKKLPSAIVCIALLASPISTYAAPDYSDVQREIERDLAKIQALEDGWPEVEKENRDASRRYRRAEASLQRCSRGPWHNLFKDPIRELEAARKNLEGSRKQLEVARVGALSALRAEQRKLKILKREFSEKTKDADYYRQYSELTSDITVKYYDVTKSVVMEGYNDYNDASDLMVDAYDSVSKECNVPFPLPTILGQVLSIVLAQINPINVFAKQITDRIPPQYRSS